QLQEERPQLGESVARLSTVSFGDARQDTAARQRLKDTADPRQACFDQVEAGSCRLGGLSGREASCLRPLPHMLSGAPGGPLDPGLLVGAEADVELRRTRGRSGLLHARAFGFRHDPPPFPFIRPGPSGR
ncbi:MAG: hypothetical protein RIC85_05365, partial [Gammaproteobacteria bacterium]